MNKTNNQKEMTEGEALKYFKNYNITLKKNDLNLYEVKIGKITIPGTVTNDEVFTTELKVGDMVGPETLIKYAEIMQTRLEEAERFK